MSDELISGKAWIGIGVTIVLTIGSGMIGCPAYSVYVAEKEGQAELARAEQNRQIQIAQSRAKKEAAQFEADAEITRAHGVAEANRIYR